MRTLAIAALVCAATATARAEDVVAYDVDGDADASGADARTAALDDAFAHAVQTVVRELVAGDVRASRKADLDREIVGHARLWVARFQVTHDTANDGRRQLSVTVRIDRDKVRDKLGQLGIALIGGDPAAHVRTVSVLLRVTTPSGVVASFGPDASADVPGLAALSAAMHAAGLGLHDGSHNGAAARGAGDLPLDDDDAVALAADAHADLALIAGIHVSDPVVVRGVPIAARLVSAHVRMVVPGKPNEARSGDAVATAIDRADDGGHALADAAGRALVAAAADVVPPAPQDIAQPVAYHGDDTPIAQQGVVLVRLPPTTPYRLVLAEVKLLDKTKDVTAANLRRLSPAGWLIGVTTDVAVDRIADAVRKPPIAGGSAQVKLAGDLVIVEVSAP
jgi:hypothetical protein